MIKQQKNVVSTTGDTSVTEVITIHKRGKVSAIGLKKKICRL